MVRPLCLDRNSLKVKPLKGNAIGLNLVGMRKLLTPNTESEGELFTPFKPRFKRFNYALQPTSCRSELRKDIFFNDSEDVFSSNEKKTTDSLMKSKPEGLSFICKSDPVVNDKKILCDTFIHDESKDKLTKRKHRMRDGFGNLVCRMSAKNPKTSKAPSPKQPKRGTVERLTRLVLHIRCLKIGTLTKIFKSSDSLTTQCTFTVDYIEIANEDKTMAVPIDPYWFLRIEASDVTSCEWCTVQRLPSLFLQTAPMASYRLRAKIVYDVKEDDSWVWYDCQSKNQEEKYIVLIFEKELTFPEQLVLEEIFREIGRSNNIWNFPVKLSFEEAYRRLKTHNHVPKQQITAFESEEDELPVMSQASVALQSSPDVTRCDFATLSVSDSDEYLFEVPSSPVQEIKIKPLQVSDVSAPHRSHIQLLSCLYPNIEQASVALQPSPDVTRCEIATLSVSDSDEDLLEVPSSPVQEIKKLVVYPPPPAKGGLTITEEDLNCLEEGTFLNDVIVDFYLRFLVCEQLKREDAVDCHVFSSFFFKHLTQEDHRRPPKTAGLSIQELRHNRVKTWTRHVNIFEKDFIFVPINQSAHWYLAVICFPGRVSQTSDWDVCISRSSADFVCDPSPPNPMSLFYRQEFSQHSTKCSPTIGDLNKSFWLDSDDDTAAFQAFENTHIHSSKSNDSKQPCILIMDSLYCRTRSSVVQILQEYLQEEWKVKNGCLQSFGKGEMEGWSPRVPQQDNFTDCGIYLLQYVERFLKDPPQNFHPSMDLNEWFSQKTVKKKRQQIKQLILKLHKEQTV